MRKVMKNAAVQAFLASILCILLGLLIGYIVLLFINPEGAWESILNIIKNFFTWSRPSSQIKQLGNTIAKTMPLILCSLSILFAYKVGLFNIGAAGQYVAGSCACLYAALAWGWSWLPCMLFAIVMAALLGAVSGFLKAYCNVNEVISGIMLNWISLYLVNMLLNGVFKTSNPQTVANRVNTVANGLANEKHGEASLKILRNERLGLLVFTVAHLWFFLNLWQTDAKECEDFKLVLTLFFGFAFVGCILYWKDFLIVRGIAVLTVLSAHRLLQIGCMSDHILRPYVSGLFYFWIVLSLYFGVCPYRARDLIQALFRNNRRRLKTVAGCGILYGILLIGLAF